MGRVSKKGTSLFSRGNAPSYVESDAAQKLGIGGPRRGLLLEVGLAGRYQLVDALVQRRPCGYGRNR
jgi:hypothetical protein